MSGAGIARELTAALEAVVRGIVRAELARAADADPDPWVPHTSWPWGSRESARRARAGLIQGARKEGSSRGRGLWFARRSALDRYIASLPAAEHKTAKAQAPLHEEPTDLADVALRCASSGGRRRRGRG